MKEHSAGKLHIIYVSTLCSKEAIDSLLRLCGNRLAVEAQKYHRLMTEGLASHPGVQVTAVSVPPVTRRITGKVLFRKNKTVADNVEYRMAGILNIPVLRHLSMLFGVMLQIMKVTKQPLNSVIICDVLNVTISIAALLPAFLKRISTVGIVTDIPASLFISPPKWSAFPARLHLNRFSSYLFLTPHMNDIINKHNRPYTVIEGHTDSKMVHRKNELSQKYPGRVCMYTGALHAIYGIEMLISAFILANIPGAVLQLYGMGDYENKLAKLVQQHENIRFGGMLPNEQIVEEQMKATLLINPRPTNQEYTKYSFPSKNMEYIASGTPLLTTKLPGMPDEYLPYVYLFEEETVEGYAKTLEKVLSLPAGELHKKGLAAKEFAMQHKNNITQAGKLLKMIREEVLI